MGGRPGLGVGAGGLRVGAGGLRVNADGLRVGAAGEVVCVWGGVWLGVAGMPRRLGVPVGHYSPSDEGRQ